VIDEWETISLPKPASLQEVSLHANETALLILDIQSNNCNEENRLRCEESVPLIQKFLVKARKKGVFVGYALIRGSNREHIRSEVAPIGDDPIVVSSVDKFYNTELENILKDLGIKNLILVGTSAHGAVLNTATGGSVRGFKIIVPVEGLSATEPYAEQYTVWHLVNSPRTRRSTILTTFNGIKFE
jgi:nicotinamidase-related amidase